VRLSYYPGCSLTGASREYDESVRETMALLGVELQELDDWNCCGASSAHMTSHELAIDLGARNLKLAAEAGDDLLVPCSACFQRLKAADKALREDPREYDLDSYAPGFEIVHITSLLAGQEMLAKIAAAVKRPLDGLPVACYYGCLSLRPPKITGETACEIPTRLDRIVAALGGRAVAWSHKTECCSGSLTMARPDISRRLIGDIVDAARRAGAKALATDCPMCQANLESRQLDLTGGDAEQALPVFFATELIAQALSDEAGGKRWKGHLIDPRKLFAAAQPETAL